MRTLTCGRRLSARKHPVVLMSINTTTGPDRSIWTLEDETRLIQFLVDHHAEAGDGANFKSSVWNAAGEELSKHVAKGGPKTAASCKSKWDRVRLNYFLLVCTTNEL